MGTILEKEEIKKKKEEQEKHLINLTLTGLLMEGTDCAGFAASEEWYSLFLARGIFPSHLRLLA
jgi:hypothetical protein